MALPEVDAWVAFGFGAQGLFFGRFLVQWIASERKKQSVIPVAFWYFSLVGSTLLFVYALHRWDIVFMLGQGLATIIYVRNLVLIHGSRRRLVADPAVPPVAPPNEKRD
jgi:lipid-A-disaccharide synthase-like uncharacterized protein